jgi:hypothetical protein
MSAYKIERALIFLEDTAIKTARLPANSREAFTHVATWARVVNILEEAQSSSGNEMIAKLLVKAKKRLTDAENLQEKLETEEAAGASASGGACASGGGGASGGGASASGDGEENEPTTTTDEKPAQ